MTDEEYKQEQKRKTKANFKGIMFYTFWLAVLYLLLNFITINWILK